MPLKSYYLQNVSLYNAFIFFQDNYRYVKALIC